MTKSCLGLILGLVFTIEVAAAQKLVFAVQPSYAKNFLQGNLDHNQVIKLARYLDIPIEVYECPWVRCVKAIETGEADIIDDLFYAEDRNTFAYYLKPHFDIQEAGFRFFADNSQTPSITSWEQLRTLRVGSLRGYKHFPLFDNDLEISKVEANTFKPLVGMILKGRLDALIVAPSFDIQSLQPFDIN